MSLPKYSFYFIFAMFVGIGRNLPFDIYPLGLTIVDVFIMLWVVAMVISGRKITYDYVARYLLILVLATLASVTLNLFIHGIRPQEVFEILRYIVLLALYCFLVQAKVSTDLLVFGFTLGNTIVFFVSYANPMNPDVLGFVQIFNPNVIGNILSVNAAILLYMYAVRPKTWYFILAIPNVFFTLFTFSKGSWLMSGSVMLVFTILILISVRDRRNLGSFLILCVGLYGLASLIAQYSDILYNYFNAKILATDFDASAAEGGSFSARAGLAYSGLLQWLYNPLLGVGISNYEDLNTQLRPILGRWYYPDDNPNNVFIYILSGSGIFAFLAWTMIFVTFCKKIFSTISESHKSRFVSLSISANIACVLLVGGFTQNEMLNAYYYWFFIAVVSLTEKGMQTNGASRPD